MNNDIQKKRNKPSSSNYRVLYAKAGHRRRLHAATTADLPSDIPNVSIGRALLVILLLHVMAIAAIYVHSTFFGSQDNTSANQGQGEVLQKESGAAAAVIIPVKTADKMVPGPKTPKAGLSGSASERYIVVTGDSYSRIAEMHNVDVRALRALNSNRPLRAGIVLDMPAELSVRPVDPAPAAPVEDEAVSKPVLVKAAEQPKPAAIKSTKPSDTSRPPKALVVEEDSPQSAPASPSGMTDSGERYTIKSGDTLWGLSQRFKVSRENLLKINNIEDPNKLFAGRTIKIPAN